MVADVQGSEKQPLRNLILAAAVATGPGAGYRPTGSLITVQVKGITTATVGIEVTLDDTNWVASGLSFTADGVGSINGFFTAFRANVTAYTSGTINVTAIA